MGENRLVATASFLMDCVYPFCLISTYHSQTLKEKTFKRPPLGLERRFFARTNFSSPRTQKPASEAEVIRARDRSCFGHNFLTCWCEPSDALAVRCGPGCGIRKASTLYQNETPIYAARVGVHRVWGRSAAWPSKSASTTGADPRLSKTGPAWRVFEAAMDGA